LIINRMPGDVYSYRRIHASIRGDPAAIRGVLFRYASASMMAFSVGLGRIALVVFARSGR